MDVLEVKTPESIVAMLLSLQLDAGAKKKLHRDLANQARRYFREKIRQQRDIHGVPYAPRRRRKPLYVFNDKKVYRQSFEQRRNMLTGLSRMIITQADENGFSVGLAGLPGQIARVHNNGEAVTYTTRMNGWFNSKTNRWEGGRKSMHAYHMPKRTFIGWTPQLEASIANTIMQHMENANG